MRTSLNEIKLIDEHLFNNGTPENGLLFDAMRIINPELSTQIMWQKKTHAVVQQYGRKKLKAEIEAVHQQLFTEPVHQSFRKRVMKFFS
jgi:hypothetical protein